MHRYTNHFNTRQTPQSEPIPGKTMAENSAGGYGFAVDDWTRLSRFLILGCEGPTYYASKGRLTKENAEAVLRCIKADGARVVRDIVAVSNSGRAPKNDPALFALALCCAFGDDGTKQTAFAALTRVARIGTHVFHFAEYCKGLRGWGRGLRKAVARWYNDMPADKLAVQIVKYQQRDGWSHRDLLRKAHPKTSDADHENLYREVTGKQPGTWSDATAIMMGVFAAKIAKSEDEIANLIRNYKLPRECIPTQWLNSPAIWEALLEYMPPEAMIRNLAKMSQVGLLVPFSQATKDVCAKLADGEALRRARLHPVKVLAALFTYGQGHGVWGKLVWTPVPQLIDALEAAFYMTFKHVQPTGKNFLIAVDMSGSMRYGEIAGVPGLTPCIGAASLALVTAATEQNYFVHGFSTTFKPLPITPSMSLGNAARLVNEGNMGGTDCALPMLYAMDNKLPVDAFLVLTDNETWAGQIHPCQALARYRQQTGRAAKLVVVGMTSAGFTIADPDDAGMLDVCGFDTAVPELISDFVR